MLKNKKQTGFVLLITLIFLFLLTLLSMGAADLSFIQTKMHSYEYERLQTNAEQGLRYAENQLLLGTHSSPVLPFNFADSDYFAPYWWQQHAMSFTFQKDVIQYVIQEITIDPCLQVIGVDKPGVTFYRITARSYLPEGREQRIIQSTIVKPTPFVSCQEKKSTKRFINAGRLSWKQIE